MCLIPENVLCNPRDITIIQGDLLSDLRKIYLLILSLFSDFIHIYVQIHPPNIRPNVNLFQSI